MAIRNMFLGDKNKQSDLLIPWCTYTEPEVAHVGKYEAELKEAGVEFESYMVRIPSVVAIGLLSVLPRVLLDGLTLKTRDDTPHVHALRVYRVLVSFVCG